MRRFLTPAVFGLSARVALFAGFLGLLSTSGAKAVIYEGKPDLPLTTSMIVAGGGPAHFSSVKLFKVLAGPLAGKEAEKLTAQFGAADVRTSFAIFDYAVDDTIGIVTAKHIELPKPEPSPANAKALAVALYGAGETPKGTWDVGYFLEHLITHPIHHAIMHDMDAKFGADHNATFHMVLDQMMHDLGVAYARPT